MSGTLSNRVGRVNPGRAGPAPEPVLGSPGLKRIAGADSEADYLASLRTGSHLSEGLVTLAEQYVRGLEGRVWSAKVYARRPA